MFHVAIVITAGSLRPNQLGHPHTLYTFHLCCFCIATQHPIFPSKNRDLLYLTSCCSAPHGLIFIWLSRSSHYIGCIGRKRLQNCAGTHSLWCRTSNQEKRRDAYFQSSNAVAL